MFHFHFSHQAELVYRFAEVAAQVDIETQGIARPLDLSTRLAKANPPRIS